MRFPATELVEDLGDRAHKDIDRMVRLWPIIAEHSRRGGVRMPVGGEGSAHSQGVHSDPTVDAVMGAMERPPEPEALMRRAMLRTLDALHRLDLARKAMEAQVPASAAAIADGRKPTDGRTMAEIVAIREHRRASVGQKSCLVCDKIAHPLPSGLCQAHYMQWYRSRGPSDDPREFVARKRAELRAEWDAARHSSIGPADGVDRRAA